MKAFLSLILFLFSSLVGFAQQDYPDSGFTNKADAKNLMVNGKKDGKWVEYGFLFWIIRADTLDYTLIEYRHGLPVGIMREYFMNGNLKGEVHYDMDGKRNGMANGYYKNGILRAEFPFTNGQLNGSLISYCSNGAIDSEATYINGVKNGVVKHYHPNGNKFQRNLPQ